MPLAIGEKGVKFGTSVLLTAPLTLATCGAPVWEPVLGAKGSSAHRKLFKRYEGEIDTVAIAALDWWEGLIGAEPESRKRKRCENEAWERRPAGPASFPGIVALVREYWLACHELNQECNEKERVAPWTFLLAWLMNGSHEEAINVLACMPYWPIGLDRDGNWV